MILQTHLTKSYLGEKNLPNVKVISRGTTLPNRSGFRKLSNFYSSESDKSKSSSGSSSDDKDSTSGIDNQNAMKRDYHYAKKTIFTVKPTSEKEQKAILKRLQMLHKKFLLFIPIFEFVKVVECLSGLGVCLKIITRLAQHSVINCLQYSCFMAFLCLM